MRVLAFAALLFAFPLLAVADDKPVVVKLNKLKAEAPPDWKSEKPKFTLRSYQFKIPAKGDMDAEIAIYPESHPNPEKSHPRWKATFVPPEGKTIDDVSKVTKSEIPGAKLTFLDINGTWKYREAPQDPKSKEMLLEDYRVVWVIVEEKDEATHIRFAGPKATVDKNYAAFEKWLKSFK